MKKNTILAILLAFGFLVGCSTSYKPEGLTGGYADMALNQDTYQVSFRGNAYTSSDQVQTFLLRRCAELTIKNGYRYFVILDSNVNVNTSYYQTPATVQTSTYGYYQGNVMGDGYYGSGSENSLTTINPGTTSVQNRYKAIAIIKMMESNDDIPHALDAVIIRRNFTE